MKFVNFDENIEDLLKEKESAIRKDNYVDAGTELIERIEDDTTLSDFIRAKDSEYAVLLTFTAIIGSELHVTCRGCTVICEAEDFNVSGDLKYGLAKPYEAIIKEIDTENKIVYVSCKDAREKSQKRHVDIDKSLDTKIKESLKAGERVVYPAKVISITSRARDNGSFYSFAILSILDTKVKGFILAKDYSQCWVSDLRNVCKKGDWIDVELISRRKSTNEPYYWNCSRLNITENPWTEHNIDERFKKGDMVIVKCVSKDAKGRCWWGACDDIKGVQVISDYESGIGIELGRYYRCYVKKVDSATKTFRVKVLAQVTIENNNLISFIKNSDE